MHARVLSGSSDDSAGNSSGVKGRLAFAVADDVEFGGTYTYDDAFTARASADLTVRFGGGSHKEKSKEQAKAEEQPQIKELSATPSNRDVRVHDRLYVISHCVVGEATDSDHFYWIIHDSPNLPGY